MQATEFGIVPDLLFCEEHPGKNIDGAWESWEGVVMPDRLRESYGLGDNGVSNRTLVTQHQSRQPAKTQRMHTQDNHTYPSHAMPGGMSSNDGREINAFGHSLSVD